MNFHYDTEFREGYTSDGKWELIPISIGIVAEDPKTNNIVKAFYAVNSDIFNLPFYDNIDFEWLRYNVIKYLPQNGATLDNKEEFEAYIKNNADNLLTIRKRIEVFVKDVNNGTPNKLYGYYSDYDHVILSQIFGSMINLTNTFDVMQTHDYLQDYETLLYIFRKNSKHYNYISSKLIKKVFENTNTYEFNTFIKEANVSTKHNALYDAYVQAYQCINIQHLKNNQDLDRFDSIIDDYLKKQFN